MRSKLLILFLVLGLLVSACGPGGGETAAPAEPAPSEEAAAPAEPATSGGGGGTVTLIIPEEPTLLNYFGGEAAIIRQVAEATSMTGLVTINENGEFVPMLAAELPTGENGGLSADHLTVTWKLKPDLKWSDGVTVPKLVNGG